MNDLRDLIGKDVWIFVGEKDQQIKAKVIDVIINDYYFEEKFEPIYIEVNVEPDLSQDDFEKMNLDYDDFVGIPLSHILKA